MGPHATSLGMDHSMAWNVRPSVSQAFVASGPRLDLVTQPEDGLSLLDSGLREVRIPPAVDADALGVGEADDLRHLVVVDEVGRIDALVGVRGHATRVVDNCNTSSTVEPVNTMKWPRRCRNTPGPGQTEVARHDDR